MLNTVTLTILPYGKVPEQQVEVQRGELILDAAVRDNVKFPYSCRNGTCRTCIVQVRSGTIIQEDVEYCMISAAELENGKRLICLCTAQSDAVIEKIGPRAEK
jgi:ferredoxin